MLAALVIFLVLVGSVTSAAAQNVYLMRGLYGGSNFGPMQNDLERHGARTEVYRWQEGNRVVNDAMQRGGRTVIIGHSQGAWAAFNAGAALQARGRRAEVIGLDPLCSGAQSSVGGVNYWGNTCHGRPAEVPGAANRYLNGGGHVGYPTDRRVRDAVVGTVYGGRGCC
jgi:hypothetical protein